MCRYVDVINKPILTKELRHLFTTVTARRRQSQFTVHCLMVERRTAFSRVQCRLFIDGTYLSLVDIIATPGLVTYTHMSVRPNAPAWWMSSLHQGSLSPHESNGMYIYCNDHTQVSVRPNTPAWWMSSLHQGSLSPHESNGMYIYCNVHTQVSVRPNTPAWWMSSLHQGSLSPHESIGMYIYCNVHTQVSVRPNTPAWRMSSLHQGSVSPHESIGMYIYCNVHIQVYVRPLPRLGGCYR